MDTHTAESVVGAVCVPLAGGPTGGHGSGALGLGQRRGRGTLTSVTAAVAATCTERK